MTTGRTCGAEGTEVLSRHPLSFDVFLKVSPYSLCAPQARLLGAVGESRKKPEIPIDKPL